MDFDSALEALRTRPPWWYPVDRWDRKCWTPAVRAIERSIYAMPTSDRQPMVAVRDELTQRALNREGNRKHKRYSVAFIFHVVSLDHCLADARHVLWLYDRVVEKELFVKPELFAIACLRELIDARRYGELDNAEAMHFLQLRAETATKHHLRFEVGGFWISMWADYLEVLLGLGKTDVARAVPDEMNKSMFLTNPDAMEQMRAAAARAGRPDFVLPL